jgi:HemY protein
MRIWLWTLVLATVAVVLAVILRENTGHVLVLVNNWRIQVSLPFAVLAIAASFFLLYLTVRLLSVFWGLPVSVKAWHRRRALRRDHELLEQGWTELLEGRYAHAEKDLTRLLGRSKSVNQSVLAALSAARAAHALGEYERREGLIVSAKEKAQGEVALAEAVATVAAELYLDHGLSDKALTELKTLQKSGAKQVHALRLFLRAYRQLNLHEQVFVLARTLNRRGALHDTEAQQIIELAVAARIRETSHSGTWQKVWSDLKSNERILPEVALAGAQAFEVVGQLDEASHALEQAIPASFDPRLLAAYARAESSQVTRRLEKAEAWLQKNPSDPDLLATVGNLCLAGQIWGQAESYLVRSLARRSDARVHVALASLYDKINRPQDAAMQWRAATALGVVLPVLAQEVFLPAADTDSDPSLLHADGLTYLADTGFPVDWSEDRTALPGSAGLVSVADKVAPAKEDIHDYFDSAPVPHLGEPAPVSSLPDPKRTTPQEK